MLLPYYSALKVAEIFRMLEALYPGRIDLGIGRAPVERLVLDAPVQVNAFSSLLKITLQMMKTSFPRKRESSKSLILFASKFLGSRFRGSDERNSTNC